MKKLLLTITFLITGIIYAQQEQRTFIEKGRWGLGGGFSLGSTEFENTEFGNLTEGFYMEVMPKVGYTIADDWLLGLDFTYGYNTQKTSGSSFSGNEASTHHLGVAPNIRKFFPLLNNLAFNLQGSLGYERRWRKTSAPSITENLDISVYSVAIRPGFSYFLGEHFALEAITGIFRYSTSFNEMDGIEIGKAQNLNLNFDLSSIQIGAFYYF